MTPSLSTPLLHEQLEEVEITDLPSLDPEQRALVDVHSTLNVLNVVRGELVLLGYSLWGNVRRLENSLRTCDTIVDAFRDPEATAANARAIDAHINAIEADVWWHVARKEGASEDPEICDSMGNLESAFVILRIRTREVLARKQLTDPWTSHLTSEIMSDLALLFAAIEKNSHGKFRIHLNADIEEPDAYAVDFQAQSNAGDHVIMPAIFRDVMRDLLANARKYTAPGGRIQARLSQQDGALNFSVSDTGRGIPKEDVRRVFEWGVRGSNVSDVRTNGGGFGLTKALLVTKQFGGRLFIATEEAHGTSIRITLPLPSTTPEPQPHAG